MRLQLTKRNKIIASVILIIFSLYFIFNYLFLYCNDAYLQADFVKVTPQISGYISKMLIKNNQLVAANQPLLEIDATPFRLAVEQKQAEFKQAQEQLSAMSLAEQGAEQDLQGIKAQQQLAEVTFQRYQYLLTTHEISQQEFDEHQTQRLVSNANLAKQITLVAQAKQALNVQQSLINSVKAQLDEANYQLSLTVLTAPTAGFVNHLRVYTGDQVIAGTPLFGLVSQSKWRIIANYQERYLAHMAIGQTVLIYLPNYPWHIWHGKIVSFGKAVAREANVMNAALPYIEPVTDWIRYPYRFPVTIEFPENHLPPELFMGMDVLVLSLP